MENKETLKSLKSHYRGLILSLFIIMFFVASFLYAEYQYIYYFLLMVFLLTGVVYLCERIFGYPTPILNELNNKTIADARENIKFLISLGTKEIIIVSGTLSHRIYNHNLIMGAFKKLSEEIQNGNLKLSIFVTENQIDEKSINFFKFLVDVNVYIHNIPTNIKHFILVDSRHVRLEEKHRPFEPHRKAILRLNTPYLAAKVEDYLYQAINKAKDQCKIIYPDQLLKQSSIEKESNSNFSQ